MSVFTMVIMWLCLAYYLTATLERIRVVNKLKAYFRLKYEVITTVIKCIIVFGVMIKMCSENQIVMFDSKHVMFSTIFNIHSNKVVYIVEMLFCVIVSVFAWCSLTEMNEVERIKKRLDLKFKVLGGNVGHGNIRTNK